MLSEKTKKIGISNGEDFLIVFEGRDLKNHNYLGNVIIIDNKKNNKLILS